MISKCNVCYVVISFFVLCVSGMSNANSYSDDVSDIKTIVLTIMKGLPPTQNYEGSLKRIFNDPSKDKRVKEAIFNRFMGKCNESENRFKNIYEWESNHAIKVSALLSIIPLISLWYCKVNYRKGTYNYQDIGILVAGVALFYLMIFENLRESRKAWHPLQNLEDARKELEKYNPDNLTHE